MPWYRVLIRGENFFMRLDGNVRRYGFYTSRLIVRLSDYLLFWQHC